MEAIDPKFETGIDGLDSLLKGILPGDNIVWHVDAVEDYLAFATPYCEAARASGRRLLYFRFAKHEPLLPPISGPRSTSFDPRRASRASSRRSTP